MPAHLAREVPQETTTDDGTTLEVKTYDEAVRLVVGDDPLARRTAIPDPHVLDEVPGATHLRRVLLELRRSEIVQGNTTETVQLMAPRYRGSEATAILRGYRLQLVDRLLAIHGALDDPAAIAELAPLLTRLRPIPAGIETLRHPLHFLATDMPLRDAIRGYGDRWTLMGWLEHPSTPLGAVADALQAPQYDALRDSKLGRLIRARAENRQGPVDQALADLQRATTLALQQAAADRDSEQAAWSDAKKSASEELGTTSPIPFLLDRALEGFIASAGDDRAVGGALVALTGLRWEGACDWDPCTGLDRIDTLTAVTNWSPALQTEVDAWRVIALKSGLDAMDVGHDTVVFSRAMVDLVDALLGTGGATLTADLLSRKAPDESVWNALGDSVGKSVTPTWADAHVALGTHLRDIAHKAAEEAEEPRIGWLSRVARRAVP